MTPPPIVLVLALLLAPAPEVTQASDVAALRELLDQFLAGASRDDAATHQRFWAEDLIYTRSAGVRSITSISRCTSCGGRFPASSGRHNLQGRYP